MQVFIKSKQTYFFSPQRKILNDTLGPEERVVKFSSESQPHLQLSSIAYTASQLYHLSCIRDKRDSSLNIDETGNTNMGLKIRARLNPNNCYTLSPNQRHSI